MASNQTENYGLNQWVRSDKVVMEDFNADNAKIDAALACHPSAELISGLTVEEDVPYLELDISQVDWNRYMALAMIVDTAEYNGFLVSLGSDEKCVHMSSRVQNTYYHSALVSLGAAAYMSMLFPIFYNGGHNVSSLALTYGKDNSGYVTCLTGGGGRSRLNQCKTIRISRNQGNFVPGDKIYIWGVK